MTAAAHKSVLLSQVVAAVVPADGAVLVDGTFGGGGYSQAFLDHADCQVWAIDRDPAALRRGQALVERYGERLHLLRGCFGEMDKLLRAAGVSRVDGVALDIGVSSPQLDDGARGFSFVRDGPLDMRMGDDGVTAADVVNTLAERELADVIYRLGEERASRAVARAIVAARGEAAIERTSQLAAIVRSVVRPARDGIDPATRTFQALRIFVNDELGELSRGLSAAETLLAPGGRLAVVSFHSLEDRVVKSFLKQRSGGDERPSRHRPEASTTAAPSFRLISRKVVRPDAEEIDANPRARSARLRIAERTAAPAWQTQEAA